MKFTIEIAQDEANWQHHKSINNKLIRSFTKKIISRYPNLSLVSKIELSILLTNDARIRELNKHFRGKDTATNVLSFPDMDEEIIKGGRNTEGELYLGDIAFAYETVDREAKDKEVKDREVKDREPKEELTQDELVQNRGAENTKDRETIQNTAFLLHFKHLLVHSILHLLGYSHEDDQAAEIMENLEVAILKEFGLDSPYAR